MDDKHSHKHGSSCSCDSSYEEEEIHYKITERVTPGGQVITEKVEVIGQNEINCLTPAHRILEELGEYTEKDLEDYVNIEIPKFKNSARRWNLAQDSFLTQNGPIKIKEKLNIAPAALIPRQSSNMFGVTNPLIKPKVKLLPKKYSSNQKTNRSQIEYPTYEKKNLIPNDSTLNELELYL